MYMYVCSETDRPFGCSVGVRVSSSRRLRFERPVFFADPVAHRGNYDIDLMVCPSACIGAL